MADSPFVIAGDTCAVFDPVGGAAGDRAAAVASEAFRKAIDEVRGDPRRALVAANAAVNQAVHDDATLKGAGCTAAAVSLTSSTATIAWAGDVRVLRLRADHVALLTREHSLMNDYVSRGLVGPDDRSPGSILAARVIVRALGMRATLDVDCSTEAVEPGDIFLLASAGLCHALGDTLLASTMIEHRHDTRACTRALLDNASANAPRDSLTAVMMVVTEDRFVPAASSKP